MPQRPCKLPIIRAALLGGALAVLALPGCGPAGAGRTFRVRELEDACPTAAQPLARLVASQPDALHRRAQALSPRLALLQVRSPAEWRRLQRLEPRVGPPPDFSRGIAVGLITRTGTPLAGDWPIAIEAAQVCDGAGLLHGRFNGGTFLVDDTAYLDLVFVEGLAAVLIVDVDGSRYFPQ